MAFFISPDNTNLQVTVMHIHNVPVNTYDHDTENNLGH